MSGWPVRRASARQEWMVGVMPIHPEDHVLELGSGQGVAATLICDLLDGGSYVGVDRSPQMTASATKRNAAHVDSGRATFLTGTVADLQLDLRFDTVLAIHFPPLLRQRAAEELSSVQAHLKEAGTLWVGIQPLPETLIDDAIEDVSRRLDRQGFSVVRVEQGAPGKRPAAMLASRPD